MHRMETVLRWTALAAIAAFSLGCAAKPARPDIAEVVLAAPSEQVKTALIQVLREGGYEVDEDDFEEQGLETGSRREILGPWNWMLRWRFGVSRSWLDARIAAESETTTRLKIEVTHEGKDSLFTSWKPYEPPVAQSAENQIRLVKNALGLL
jgi:hypothetical protein